MGKASRRKKEAQGKTKVAPAPHIARPFAGLPGEADWVAAYEILPAATATLTLRADAVPEGAPETVTLATVLPMAWPALVVARSTREAIAIALAAFSGCRDEGEYPNRPITLVCPWSAGGGTDRVSRGE